MLLIGQFVSMGSFVAIVLFIILLFSINHFMVNTILTLSLLTELSNRALTLSYQVKLIDP